MYHGKCTKNNKNIKTNIKNTINVHKWVPIGFIEIYVLMEMEKLILTFS